MPTAKEGQIVQMPDGSVKQVKGGKLVPYSGGAPGSPVKMTNPDRARLNKLSEEAQEASTVRRQYRDAQSAIKRLKPGPFRGRFLQMALPDEGGGVLDTIGATIIGAPARMIGAISKQDADDYQRLRALQSDRVLQAQLAQKGPQTESDAARLQMTEISPMKSQKVNEDIVRRGTARLDRVINRADFYTKWANRYGLNGLDPQGRSADQVWAAVSGGQGGAPAGRPRIKRIK